MASVEGHDFPVDDHPTPTHYSRYSSPRVNLGLPNFTIVGLTDRAIQEARERVRASIRNAGFQFPQRRLTVILAPAEVPKEDLELPVFLRIVPREGSAPLVEIEQPQLDADPVTIVTVDGIELIGGPEKRERPTGV
jgi:Subunit ChlI of Mg-chelatase